MRIRYHRKLIKQYAKAQAKIQYAFEVKIKLFAKDQYHSALNNHQLKGLYENARSINITADWRAIFEESADKKTANFLLLGTHSQLYK